MTTTDKDSNPEEVKNVIQIQREQMKHKNARPDWIEYDPEKKKKSVSIANRGEYIYKQHGYLFETVKTTSFGHIAIRKTRSQRPVEKLLSRKYGSYPAQIPLKLLFIIS